MIAFVIGDLTVGPEGNSKEVPAWDMHRESADISIVFEPTLVYGGTALLFGNACRAIQDVEPVIVSSIGSDCFGDQIRTNLSALGFDDRAVHVTPHAMTCMVSIAYLPGGSRFMLRPHTHAGKYLDPRVVSDLTSEA